MLLCLEIFLLALAVVVAWPDTPLGKYLRVLLIENPTRTLSGMTGKKAAIKLIVVLCLLGMVLLAPEWVAIVGIGDLSLYFDVTVIALLLSTIARSRSALAPVTRLGRAIALRFHSRFGRPRVRSRRARLRKPGLPPPSDEDGAGRQWAFA